ncbi:hypothetical protein E2C01_040027 [Portunus trituberculatus]|uniref:Uncharacterized protein n=1 Tax=Portunus trituberculatus TaxID=210409 RepID=A0A5B7FGB3_PORTR|nr:hypothetical protein [Portunus trituberculatus]
MSNTYFTVSLSFQHTSNNSDSVVKQQIAMTLLMALSKLSRTIRIINNKTKKRSLPRLMIFPLARNLKASLLFTPGNRKRLLLAPHPGLGGMGQGLID